MADPYLIAGPALISFSGGRTSAYMLNRILEAHGGALPSDVHAVFANTGKEREETLQFVRECGRQWGVRIRWLEWRNTSRGFEEVDANSASREGEPFEALIRLKKAVPNWQARWCTGMLKVKVMIEFMSSLGFEPGTYIEAIGLRHDEGPRLLRMYENNEKHSRQCVAPLSKAKVVKADVMEFWRHQDFDLELQPWEGNCDCCFLKGRELKKRIIRDRPKSPLWWRGMEDFADATFDRRDSMADLIEEVERSPELLDFMPPEEYDAECGLTCGTDDTARQALARGEEREGRDG